jgi:acyl carrier protein
MAESGQGAGGANTSPLDVFEIVAQTMVEECEVPREKITPEAHVVDDLGLDSLAFLDVCYAIDVKLKIKIPYEEWVNGVNAGKVDTKTAFTLRAIVAEIELLLKQRDQEQLQP